MVSSIPCHPKKEEWGHSLWGSTGPNQDFSFAAYNTLVCCGLSLLSVLSLLGRLPTATAPQLSCSLQHNPCSTSSTSHSGLSRLSHSDSHTPHTAWPQSLSETVEEDSTVPLSLTSHAHTVWMTWLSLTAARGGPCSPQAAFAAVYLLLPFRGRKAFMPLPFISWTTVRSCSQGILPFIPFILTGALCNDSHLLNVYSLSPSISLGCNIKFPIVLFPSTVCFSLCHLLFFIVDLSRHAY